MINPDELTAALDALDHGATADSLESETLDFKRDPSTVPEFHGNARARLIEELTTAVICFSNAQGGLILLGVDDKATGRDAFIGTSADPADLRSRIHANTTPPVTVDISEIMHGQTRLLAIRVIEGLDLVTNSKGVAHQRQGTDCRPMKEEARRHLSHTRRNPDYTARRSERSVSDIDRSALAEVRELLRALPDLRRQMADLHDDELLRSLGAVDRQGDLLVAGELLLCQPDHDTVDLLTRPSPGSEPSTRRLRLPLVQAFTSVMTHVTSTINPEVTSIPLPSGQELTLPDFSPLAVEEAVTNALVHRDHGLRERVVVDHSATTLTVHSPGPLPFGVEPDRLLSTVSTPRNPQLMSVLQHLGLAERTSRGIDRMFREQVRVGQAQPVIEADDYSVTVRFTTGAPNRAFARFLASLPTELRENVDAVLLLDHLCRKPLLTVDDAARILQVTPQEAGHRADALVSGPHPLVERSSSTRRGPSWRLSPSTAAGLGTAVVHRTKTDQARRRVEAHLGEYGWITNKTVRNMFDLDVQQARQILADLRDAGVLVKDPAGPERGPTVRWLAAKKSNHRS
ncbi:RNA-binding domain-containing protein [Micrococcus sp.]|uniref:RNA-binding domain-containing protein n=1 Tax=Micrococcus sp. TaxID=1271 RepID=UPI002A91D28C|nr:RNA-binding domain-containing protein [Micrococcus sp.]MDY6055986.1 putative DNA binding domain-containing protein [Micrococcus sp.]